MNVPPGTPKRRPNSRLLTASFAEDRATVAGAVGRGNVPTSFTEHSTPTPLLPGSTHRGSLTAEQGDATANLTQTTL
jgi:hypothetical protein